MKTRHWSHLYPWCVVRGTFQVRVQLTFQDAWLLLDHGWSVYAL